MIFAAFGYNGSFAGKAGIAKLEQRVDKFLSSVISRAYNGKSAPQVVLLSPTADEDIKEVKAATVNNANLQLYTAVLKKMAAKHKVAFVDVLRSHDKAKVLTALDTWVKGKAPKSQLEALWMYQSLDTVKPELLTSVIKSDKELVAAAACESLRALCGSMDKSVVLSLLSYGASHPSQHVRREAVICASYVGGEEAVKAILPVLDAKAGVHLRYAINSALNSATLAPF